MVTRDPIKKLLNNYEQVLSNYKAQVAGKFSSPDLFEYNSSQAPDADCSF